MRKTITHFRVAGFAAALGLAGGSILAQAPAASPAVTGSPWNGDWVLSQTRNPPDIKSQAAAGYRFNLGPGGKIRWEIPSLHEIVEGRTDGVPMQIHRPGSTSLSLAVTADGPQTLLYKLSRDGKPLGEGRMTLAEGNKMWVDISGPAGRPDQAGVVIYVRPDAAGKSP